MSDHILDQRRQALENSFFAQVDRQLLERLQAETEQKEQEEALTQLSGIRDPDLLRRLVKRGISPSTWAALSLVPLVEVAWADGHVVDREREAILKAAHENGVVQGSPAFVLLEQWMHARPDPGLRAAWKEYVAALCETAEPAGKVRFREEVLSRAQAVAEAWGGFLGMGSTVSEQEQAVLDDLESALS